MAMEAEYRTFDFDTIPPCYKEDLSGAVPLCQYVTHPSGVTLGRPVGWAKSTLSPAPGDTAQQAFILKNHVTLDLALLQMPWVATPEQIRQILSETAVRGQSGAVVTSSPGTIVSTSPPPSMLAILRAMPPPRFHIHDHFCVVRPGAVIAVLNALRGPPVAIDLFDDKHVGVRISDDVATTDWRSARRHGHDALCESRTKQVRRSIDKPDIEYRVLSAESSSDRPVEPTMRTLRILWSADDDAPSDKFYIDIVKMHDNSVFVVLTVDYRFRLEGRGETSAFDRNSAVCQALQALLTGDAALRLCQPKVVEYESRRLRESSADSAERTAWQTLMQSPYLRRRPVADVVFASVPAEFIALLEGYDPVTGTPAYPGLVACLDPTPAEVDKLRPFNVSRIDLWVSRLRNLVDFLGPCEYSLSLVSPVSDEDAQDIPGSFW